MDRAWRPTARCSLPRSSRVAISRWWWSRLEINTTARPLATDLGGHLSGLHGAHELHRLVTGRHLQHVLAGELLGVLAALCPHPPGGRLAVVVRAPELDPRAEHRPVRTRLAVRHAHAAGIDDPQAIDLAVELHVRVAAHHEVGLDPGHQRPHTLVGSLGAEDVHVVARDGVAEEHPADAFHTVDADRRLERGEEVALPLVDLAGAPARERAGHWSFLLAVELVDQPAVGVAAHEPGVGQPAQDVDRFRRHGP